jgi:hypothetical protein
MYFVFFSPSLEPWVLPMLGCVLSSMHVATNTLGFSFQYSFTGLSLQRVRDMPLLLRRMVGELMDPQRAIPLVHRTRILFFVCLRPLFCTTSVP